MGKKYSKKELEALQSIFRRNGNILYVNNFNIEAEFYTLTDIERKSGPLYMAFWRYTKGYYNDLLAC